MQRRRPERNDSGRNDSGLTVCLLARLPPVLSSRRCASAPLTAGTKSARPAGSLPAASPSHRGWWVQMVIQPLPLHPLARTRMPEDACQPPVRARRAGRQSQRAGGHVGDWGCSGGSIGSEGWSAFRVVSAAAHKKIGTCSSRTRARGVATAEQQHSSTADSSGSMLSRQSTGKPHGGKGGATWHTTAAAVSRQAVPRGW